MDELEKRVKQIQVLFQYPEHDLKAQVIFATFSCFTPDELCKLYIEKLDSKQFRHKLQQHIVLSIRRYGSERFIPFVEKLFELLSPYQSQRSIWVNALLYQIIEYFPIAYAEKYFEILLHSHRGIDKERAYLLAQRIWNDEIESLLWIEWANLKPEQCLVSLIKHCHVENLQKHFKEVWADKNIPKKVKRSALFRVIESDFAFAEDIRDTDPITYLYSAARVGKLIYPELSYKLALESKNFTELGIAIWCLGQFGHWEMILQLNEEIPELSSKLKLQKDDTPYLDRFTPGRDAS